MAGVLFFAIPIVYHYIGSRETDKLTQEFEQILEEVQEDETEMEETGRETEASISEEDAAIFAEGDVIAILEIEAIDIRYPVVEGCSSSILNKAIGHMSETGRIGEKETACCAVIMAADTGSFSHILIRLCRGYRDPS